MACNVESISYFVGSPANVKLVALESTLQQSFCILKELAAEVEHIFVTYASFKSELSSQTENKCKTCSASEQTKKSLVLTLTQFIETNDWAILNKVFNILYGDTISSIPKQRLEQCQSPSSRNVNSPEKQLNSTTEDISFQEESVTEIDGTPTGRNSPIIQLKKTRSTASGLGEKKKLPTNWSTPDKKALKTNMLTPTRYTPNAKLRQGRLPFLKVKENNTVDLTHSPEFSGGTRCSPSKHINYNTQTIIKKEPVSNDDTILPSPTSGPVEFILLKNTTKDGQLKSKSLSRRKRLNNQENILNNKMNDSVNLLAYRLNNQRPSPGATKHNEVVLSPQKRPLAENINCTNIEATSGSPTVNDFFKIPGDKYFERCVNKAGDTRDSNQTECDNDDSISLLKHVHLTKYVEQNDTEPRVDPDATCCETIADIENNLLPCGQPTAGAINAKNKQQPLYKAPAPRTKAEKRALPGWSCKECEDFWPEVYKNDPEMIKKKMDECSKHRGKHNPVRPNTPEGYWNPRWDVPDDTEAFNRRNNVV